MKQKDKQMISQLEKKLKAEQEARAFVEKQLMEEKKRKKLEEATAARAVAFAAATRYFVPSEAAPGNSWNRAGAAEMSLQEDALCVWRRWERDISFHAAASQYWFKWHLQDGKMNVL